MDNFSIRNDIEAIVTDAHDGAEHAGSATVRLAPNAVRTTASRRTRRPALRFARPRDDGFRPFRIY